MSYNPTQPLTIVVEIQINGLWTTITSRARAAGGVNITAGKTPGAQQGESSRMSCVIGNPDGWLTEDNPLSPWFGYVGRGCPIRLSLAGVLASPVVRFFGAIDTMQAVNPGGPDATMAVTAVGQITQLGQGEAFGSALFRSISAASPVAHWPMEDGSSATSAASAIAGVAPLTPVGVVAFGAAGPAGAQASVDFSGGGSLGGLVPAMSGTWGIVIAYQLTTLANQAIPLGFTTSDGTRWQIQVDPTGTPNVALQVDTGTGFGSVATNAPVGDLGWHVIQVNVAQNGANYDAAFGVDGSLVGSIPSVRLATAVPHITNLSVAPANSMTSHAFFATQVAITPLATINTVVVNLVSALNGFAGETASARFTRVCGEEGIPAAATAASRVKMGPQPMSTLTAVLQECESADQGVMHDQTFDGTVTLATVAGMSNQSPALAITSDALEPDPGATWDNQLTVNDVTSSRPGGSSAHLSDEAHVAKVRQRYPQSPSVNLNTDDELIGDAGWRLNKGTAPGPRVPALGLNMRNANAAAYATQVLGVQVGSRLTAAAGTLPPQYPPGGLDQLVVGWTETLDAVTWLWRPNCEPYSPYKVAVYGTDRYDSASSTLVSGVASAATSLQVLNSTNIWTTDPTQFPFDVGVAGEQVTVSAIASSITDAFTRTTSPGWGTPTTTPGAVWAMGSTAPASIASTNGTQGLMAPAANSSYDGIVVIDVGSTTWDVTIRVKSRAVPVGGNAFDGWIPCYVDASNYYYAAIRTDTAGITTARFSMFKAAVFSDLASTFITPTLATGDVWMRCRFDASTHTISLKVWQDGSTEPLNWTLQTVDTSFTSTKLGVYAWHAGTSPTTHVFDDFAVLNPQTFTVVRAVNGVVKAQAAGAKVGLWTPTRYAH